MIRLPKDPIGSQRALERLLEEIEARALAEGLAYEVASLAVRRRAARRVEAEMQGVQDG